MSRSSTRLLALVGALTFSFVQPAPAVALDYHWWYWTTQNDANPLPYSECSRRAPDALSKAGLPNAVQSGTDPNTYVANYDSINVILMCIPQARGFNMVLSVVVSDAGAAHGSSTDWGNAINNWFWGTQSAQPGPAGSLTGRWQLATNCGWGPNKSWQAILLLTQAADGSLSGTVQSDNNTTGASSVEVRPDATGYGNANPSPSRSAVSGNAMGLFLHLNTWISILQLSGQINGNQISGSVHHYGSDDCSFTMNRQ